ncbi:MAG: VOC family protein [Polyangiaceae bacterium]
MVDHIGLRVKDLKASVRLYSALLTPLEYELVAEGDDYAGYGKAGRVELWLHPNPDLDSARNGAHVAFRAANRKAVQAFHKAGLKHDGRDHGAPGLRKDYGEGYYAAFILDGNGNNLEAVFQEAT